MNNSWRSTTRILPAFRPRRKPCSVTIPCDTLARPISVAPDSQITVLLVDDHPVVLDGIKAMLSLEADIRVVGEVTTGEEAIRAYKANRPAVMIFDLLLPDMNGSDAIRQICSESGSTQIIVLTTVTGDEEIYRALEAGARGYLFKDFGPARSLFRPSARVVADPVATFPRRSEANSL